MLDPYHLTLILVALITGVISPLVINLIKYSLFFSKKEKKCDVSKNLKNEDLITKKLGKIKDHFKCDRVWICEFHNGGHTFSGKSIQKFSQTYEVVGRGISKEGTFTQNIPTSLFSTFFNEVSLKSEIYISDVDTVDTSLVNSLKSFFDSRGVKSFAASVIKNIEGSMIGVLCIDFVIRNDSFKHNDLHALREDASIIAGYLENQLK
jgi:hypothetical protein